MIFNRKYKGLRHYERIRDKLTIREKPKVNEVKVEDCGNSYNVTSNTTDGLSSILALIPLFFAFGLIAATISLLVGGLK